MRSTLTLGTIFALIWVVATANWVQAQQTAPKPDNAGATAVAPVKSGAQLRVELHRTMADLIEAQAAEKPDPAKIKELADRVQALRGEIRGQGPAGAPCPWGGPGMGAGRGPGMGYGRGYGMGYGRGYGRGAGWGGGGGGRAFVDENNNGICDYYEALGGRK